MAVLRTTLGIDAAPAVVWDVLADFPRWSEWNTAVPSISGEPAVGSSVSLRLVLPGRPAANVKATLTEVVPGRRLRWRGNIGADWFFLGDRDFVIEDAGDGGTRFTHVEQINGAFVPVFRLIMGGAIQAHHDGLNAALKARAEEIARGGNAPPAPVR